MSQKVCRSLRPSRQCIQHQQTHLYHRISTHLLPRHQHDDQYQPRCLPSPTHHNHITPRPQWHRHFSTHNPLRAGGGASRASRPQVKKPAMPSVSLSQAQMQREAINAGEIPDDVGLLPDTFIMPFGKHRPSWFGDFKARWKLEKRRLRTRVWAFVGLLTWRYIHIRPRPTVAPRTLAPLAKALHAKMYTYFAAGNLDAIAPSLCPGLLASLRARIAQRPPNTYLKWTLHSYISKPKLVSLQAGILPGAKGETKFTRNGVMQAVVRIHSMQSLQHVKRVTVKEGRGAATREVGVDAAGREMLAGEAPRPKETVEYFVLQSVLRRSKMAPWMVWGTAEETTVQKIEREERGARGPRKGGRSVG